MALDFDNHWSTRTQRSYIGGRHWLHARSPGLCPLLCTSPHRAAPLNLWESVGASLRTEGNVCLSPLRRLSFLNCPCSLHLHAPLYIAQLFAEHSTPTRKAFMSYIFSDQTSPSLILL
jgi:hypothetical protein